MFDETLLCPFVHGTFERLCQVLRERVRKQPARQVRAVAPAESRSLQVLMAEDNEPNQRVARALLRAAGYTIDIASDGAKAVEKANTHRYDVILMDLHMPVMDGLEATRSLRKQDNSRDVPIIGLTASAMKEDREKCLEAGMNDHLAKPVDWDHLIRLLGDLERKIYGVKAVA